MLRVVESLDGENSVADTMTACNIERSRWPSFEKALSSLYRSDMLQ